MLPITPKALLCCPLPRQNPAPPRAEAVAGRKSKSGDIEAYAALNGNPERKTSRPC